MIAVFGASITQQKNGFATRLNKHFNLPIKVFGFGGMHLNNAAICFIDKVMNAKPDYCFIDWFSTGYNEISDKTVQYIDTIINKCSKNKCKPIFLFLPFKDIPNKHEFHSFCKSVLNKRKVFFIDVKTEATKDDIDKILSDDRHTHEYGSNLYSKIIYEIFIENRDNITVPSGLPDTPYTCIKKLAVNREFKNYIKLSGNCEIVGFLLRIGPYSGLIKIIANGSESYTVNTWDKWCHYIRKQFDLPMRVLGNVQMNILQDHFDTSACKEQLNFKKKQKKLIVHDIYYVGNDLVVDNIYDGSKIKIISPIMINAFGRLNQYKKKLFKSLWKN